MGFRDDPVGYCREVLGLTLTDCQTIAAELLLTPPYRLLLSSGHSIGKTRLAAALVCWWFDTRSEAVCLTTAPTERQVVDLLWKEVRILRARAGLGDFAGPKTPRLETDPGHFAHGYTATDATRFQGHHAPGGVFVVFDEADGVDAPFWESAPSMLDQNSLWLCLYNPTGQGTGAHRAETQAEEQGLWHRLTWSCLDHPNVQAELQGLPPPIPGAITLGQVEAMLAEDSLLLGPDDPAQPGDVELRGKRYRPGPIAEARVLGRRPTSGTSGVWSEELWKRVLTCRLTLDPSWPVAVGCDVARYGDDQTVLVVRKGLCVLHAESHVKLSTSRTAARLREVCEHFKDPCNDPRRIPCMIDEGGIGGGVIDQADGYLFVPVNASCRPRNAARYFNVRAELAFTARALALAGKLDVSRLAPGTLARLRAELLAQTYAIEPTAGRLKIRPKEEIKNLLKRSPDLGDAFNLSLYPPGGFVS